MNKAVFLDRDGVIIEDKDCLYKKEDIQLTYGVEDLYALKEKGFKLLVITNQTVIARGLISEEGVNEIHTQINLMINQRFNFELDHFYTCPHHPNANLEKYRINCSCRKPLPGLILQAAKDFDIDLSQSWMIGDRISDIIAGKKAGCKTILLEREYSMNKIQGAGYDDNILPDFKFSTLKEAISKITNDN